MRIIDDSTLEKIKNSKLLIYGTIFLIMCIIVFLIRGQKLNETARRDEMKRNPTVVVGEVQRLKKVYKDHDRFEYTFQFNDTLYYGWSNSNGKATDYSNLSGHLYTKFFPVLLSAKDPKKYSTILIVPEDFEEYGLKFPDSLGWVMEYIDR